MKVPKAIGCRTLGQLLEATIPLAIAKPVFMDRSASSIAKVLPTAPRPQILDAISRAGSTFIHDLDSTIQAEVLHTIVSSMRKVYILLLTAGSLVLMVSLFMKRGKLFLKADALR